MVGGAGMREGKAAGLGISGGISDALVPCRCEGCPEPWSFTPVPLVGPRCAFVDRSAEWSACRAQRGDSMGRSGELQPEPRMCRQDQYIWGRRVHGAGAPYTGQVVVGTNLWTPLRCRMSLSDPQVTF